MSSPTPEPNHTARQSLAHLAAGELGGLAAWRLRRQIARDPQLAREWAEVQQLWGNLRSLQTLDARPTWQTRQTGQSTASAADRPAPSKKALLVPRVAAAVACAASVTAGGMLTVRWLQPVPEQSDAPQLERRIWFIQTRHAGRETMRGWIRIYDTRGALIATYRCHGDPYTPVVQNVRTISATVGLKGEAFQVRGAGRHLLRSRKPHRSQTGILEYPLLGYVELIPKRPTERIPADQVWTDAREHQQVVDGWGKAFGYVIHERKPLNWAFSGVGEVQFRSIRTGRILQRGLGRPLNTATRAALQKQLDPWQFGAEVASTVPGTPDLGLTVNGKDIHVIGYNTLRLSEADLEVQIVPIAPDKAQSTPSTP